jgi:hypothetical protein
VSGSTLSGVAAGRQPGATWVRRAAVTLLAVVCAIAASGALGVRTSEAGAAAEGYDLEVHYPSVARAGLDTRFEVVVTREQTLPPELTIALDADYLDLFESQAFHPEPTESTRDGDLLYLTFATAPGSRTFVVAYDAYLQPAAQVGDDATVSLWSSGRALVSASLTTRVIP